MCMCVCVFFVVFVCVCVCVCSFMCVGWCGVCTFVCMYVRDCLIAGVGNCEDKRHVQNDLDNVAITPERDVAPLQSS